MQRIRNVKPDFFHHERLFKAEVKTGLPIRLAFVGLFSCCDREGRFRWQPNELKTQILPYDEIDMGRILSALQRYRFIKSYRAEGRRYGYIPSWTDHQTINARERPSILPSPPGWDDRRVESEYLDTDSSEKFSDKTQQNADLNCEKTVSQAQNRGKTSAKPRSTRSIAIKTVFNHWKSTLNYPNSYLDQTREKVIKRALKMGYSVEQLCDAITGITLIPHYMGRNDQGERYDGVELIFRDADHIDRFIRKKHEPNAVFPTSDRLMQRNAKALTQFFDQESQKTQVFDVAPVDNSKKTKK